MDDQELMKLVDNLINSDEPPSTTKYIFNSSSCSIANTIAVDGSTQLYLIDSRFPVKLLKCIQPHQSSIFVIIMQRETTIFDFLLKFGNVIFIRTLSCTDIRCVLLCMMRIVIETMGISSIKTIYPCIINYGNSSVDEFMIQLKIIAATKTVIPYIATPLVDKPHPQKSKPAPVSEPVPSQNLQIVTKTLSPSPSCKKLNIIPPARNIHDIQDELIRIIDYHIGVNKRKSIMKDTGLNAKKYFDWYHRTDESQLTTAVILHWIIQRGYSEQINTSVIGHKETQSLLAYREIVVRSDQYDYRINAE